MSISVEDKKNTSFNEEIKKLRANIKFSLINSDAKVICVTSSVPGEGKSLISANLAASFAEYGESVLLIDCDLRRGRQKQKFNIPTGRANGLSNLLINRRWSSEYSNYISSTKIPNLYVIPSGPYPPNPSELLASEVFIKIIDELRGEYSMIILDCPPLEGLNDALAVASIADTTILVVKHKDTPMNLLEKSKKSLDNVGAKIAGVVLNQIEQEASSYYYYEYYSDNS